MNPTSYRMNTYVFPETASVVFVLQNWNYRFLCQVWFLTNPVLCLFISIIDALLFSPRNYFFKFLRLLQRYIFLR